LRREQRVTPGAAIPLTYAHDIHQDHLRLEKKKIPGKICPERVAFLFSE